MAEESTRRVELVAESNNSKQEAARTGLGLMIGLFLGRNSLIGAATGSEQFEFAIAHFVGVVLAAVAGCLLLGGLYDRSVNDATTADEDEAAETTDDTDGATPVPMSESTTELPLGMPT